MLSRVGADPCDFSVLEDIPAEIKWLSCHVSTHRRRGPGRITFSAFCVLNSSLHLPAAVLFAARTDKAILP